MAGESLLGLDDLWSFDDWPALEAELQQPEGGSTESVLFASTEGSLDRGETYSAPLSPALPAVLPAQSKSLSESHQTSEPVVGTPSAPQTAQPAVTQQSSRVKSDKDSKTRTAKSEQTSSDDGALRKRGRPKGSVNTHLSGLTPKMLQERLAAKMAQLEKLKKENERLSQKSQMLQLVVQARDEQLLRLQMIKAGQADKALSIINLTAQTLHSVIPLKDLAQKLKDLMQQAASVLVQGELRGEQQQVSSRMHDTREAIKYVELLRPEWLLLSGRDLTTPSANIEDFPVATAAHWSNVLVKVELSPEQCKQAWVLSELHCRWHGKLLKARAAITQELSGTLSTARYPTRTSQNQVVMSFDDGIMTEEQEEILAKLNSNINRERCLIVLVADVFRTYILNHSQYARLLLHSYPYCPDWIAILNASALLHAAPGPASASLSSAHLTNMAVLPPVSLVDLLKAVTGSAAGAAVPGLAQLSALPAASPFGQQPLPPGIFAAAASHSANAMAAAALQMRLETLSAAHSATQAAGLGAPVLPILADQLTPAPMQLPCYVQPLGTAQPQPRAVAQLPTSLAAALTPSTHPLCGPHSGVSGLSASSGGASSLAAVVATADQLQRESAATFPVHTVALGQR